MTLISSVSGIRGTIGGVQGENLTPYDIVKFTSAYATFIKQTSLGSEKIKVVVGKDARSTSTMIEHIVLGTLAAMGIDVINLGLTTTPTVEVAIPDYNAQGGIIITASHNPENWNGLKFLNHLGEFLTIEEGKIFEKILSSERIEYVEYNKIGKIEVKSDFIEQHIEKVLKLPLVDFNAISSRHFSIVVDAINSAGAVSIKPLLYALGVTNVHVLNDELTGIFAHNPEPLPEHLTELSGSVVERKADLGIAVDPDVDRLAFVMEDGKMFGEEYTLVAVADYVLQNTPGNTVSNLSSTQALRIITEKYNQKYEASAVGEVNVVKKMKEINAVIGGEGNGGVIYPELHYGRDALVGLALFLTYLAKSKMKMTELRAKYPDYYISKHKINLTDKVVDFADIAAKISEKYQHCNINTEDGLKIILNDEEWVHLRPSNTEPVIRVYAESISEERSNFVAKNIIDEIGKLLD